MQKANPSPQKAELRALFLAKRKSLSSERRQAAATALVNLIAKRPYATILSFYSFLSEIDVSSLNHILATNERLCLPRMERGELTAYRVACLEKSLCPSQSGIHEPLPSFCPPIFLSEIEAILVPALAFDQEGYRLGYGKGYYDKLIARAGKDTAIIGVGFAEQLASHPLPREAWDLPVQELLLV